LCLETPTLLIWGDADSALSLQTALGTEAHVYHLTFRRLSGISHWVQQDAREAVNRMLEAWLTGRPVPEYRDVAV
jgi:pimeloyl-ACP methyl ester carboxylesterase